jgi:hypothetical protein
VSTRPAIRRLWRPWVALGGSAIVLIAVAAASDPGTSTLPVMLPVALISAATAGALAAIVAIGRGLAYHSPADDDEALVELRGRQAMRLAIGLAPVLLGVALAVVLGHRASLVAAGIAAATVATAGAPRAGWLQAVDTAWNERGLRASIVRATTTTSNRGPEHP